MAFASDRDGVHNLYWKAADGTGAVERLNESENSQYPSAFTPDGKQLVFLESGGEQGRSDLGVLSLEGSPEPLLATEFTNRNAELSPDGRWLAYQSNASGQTGDLRAAVPERRRWTVADLEGRWYAASVGSGRTRVVLSGSRRKTDGG